MRWKKPFSDSDKEFTVSFTNAQYDSVKRIYDGHRIENQAEHDRRVAYVESNVDGYRELSDAIVSLSMESAKRRLNGETVFEDDLGKTIADLISQKKALLAAAGLPEDYLDPIYTCKDCKDTGYINGERCHCLKKIATSMLYTNSNIEEYLRSVDFSMMSDEYYTGNELTAYHDTYDKAISFVENFDSDFKNLVIYGTVGSGKSLISACIAKALIEKGYSVLYFSVSTLIDLLSKYSFDYKSKQDLYSAYADIFECDLLVIDDLGTETVNNFTMSSLFTVINERHINKKSTIISTNLSPQALDETYTQRIYSRLVGDYTFCKLYGPDIRFKTKFHQ